MARYIKSELIEKHINREDHYTPDERWRPESEFAKLIDSIPTADVVEVVRCKDCKYHCANYCTRDIKGRINMFYMEDEDFAVTERRWSK